MSDPTDLAPTNGTDLALTWCHRKSCDSGYSKIVFYWHLCYALYRMLYWCRLLRTLSMLTFLSTMALFPFLHMPRNATLSKTMYEFSDSFVLNSEYFNEFSSSQTQVFYPRPVLAFGYCRWLRLSVCVCGKHLLVRAITCHAFKLESPNLEQNTLVKIPIVLGGNWPWTSRSNLT